MQRMAPNSVPASKPMPVKPDIIEEASPALLMARRIRSEQGVEQLKRFLNSMEPFVAPAERMKIAESMGVRLNPSGPKAEPQAAKPISRGRNAQYSQHSGDGAKSGQSNVPSQLDAWPKRDGSGKRRRV